MTTEGHARDCRTECVHPTRLRHDPTDVRGKAQFYREAHVICYDRIYADQVIVGVPFSQLRET